MQKNVAGQKIGAQMVSSSDGSAFTGSVTVYVTGDAGTQALGSVGSGVCTHEGNGYHTYAPSQAETNYDLIAFTFVGTGAVPATVQVPTRVDANVTQLNGSGQSLLDLKDFADTGYDPIGHEVLSVAGLGPDAIQEACFQSGAITADTIVDGAITTAKAPALANLDVAVSTLGTALTAQQVRDAQKLAPSAGAAAAGSIDAKLDAADDKLDSIDASVAHPPVSQVPVPPSRTWILSIDGVHAEKPLKARIGAAQLYAVDFSHDLPTNGRVRSVESVTLLSGTNGGLLFPADDRGIDRTQIKFMIERVTAGTYTFSVKGTYDAGDGGGPCEAVCTLIVES